MVLLLALLNWLVQTIDMCVCFMGAIDGFIPVLFMFHEITFKEDLFTHDS